MFPTIQSFIDSRVKTQTLNRPFITKIPKMPWFFGDMNSVEAHEALEGQPIGNFFQRIFSEIL